MLCSTIPPADPINLCAEDDARLWVGTTALVGIHARLQNLGSGHISIHSVTKQGNEAYIAMPDVAPGFYLLQLTYGTGSPVMFTPYTLTGSSFVAAADSYLGVTLEIEGVKKADGSTYTSNDQWVSI